jgi:hypothetical protein
LKRCLLRPLVCPKVEVLNGAECVELDPGNRVFEGNLTRFAGKNRRKAALGRESQR